MTCRELRGGMGIDGMASQSNAAVTTEATAVPALMKPSIQ